MSELIFLDYQKKNNISETIFWFQKKEKKNKIMYGQRPLEMAL